MAEAMGRRDGNCSSQFQILIPMANERWQSAAYFAAINSHSIRMAFCLISVQQVHVEHYRTLEVIE